MDVYSFLNSKDVAEHCRKLDHQFNSIEASFVISRCYRLSIKEKHSAFCKLMETMPDMKLPEKLSFKLDDLSLFHSLSEKIKLEDVMLDKISCGNEKTVYTYSLFNAETKDERRNDQVFSTFERAKKAAEDNAENELIIIRMAETDTQNTVKCYLNREHEIGEIDVRDEEYNDVVCFLEDIWIFIPTPFEKGDLLYMPVKDIAVSAIWSNIPMILTFIDHWNKDEKHIKHRKEYGDSSDMTAFGYWIDPDGKVYHDCCHAYQDLEYYRGKLIEVHEK